MTRTGIPLSIETLRTVGIIVDAQGFTKHGKFHVGEIAFFTGKYHHVFKVRTQIVIPSRVHCYQQRHHGLELNNDEGFRQQDLPVILRMICQMFLRPGELIGCKNTLLAEMLTSFHLPFVNFEHGPLVCPTVSELKSKYPLFLPPGRNVSAGNKVKHLYSWMQDILIEIILSPLIRNK